MKGNIQEQIDQEATSNSKEDAADVGREEWGTVTVSRFNRDDETVIDWLEPLTTSAPPLLPNFYSSTNGQVVNLTKETFHKRFSWCLRKLKLSPLPVELVDELFHMAVSDWQQMTAYLLFEKTLKEPEFNNTLDFIERERQRMDLISTALDLPWNPIVPPKVCEWKTVWLGSLRELVGTIKAQLQLAENIMSNQKGWLTSGRTNLESHLLWAALSSIRPMLKRQKLRVGSIPLLVAYGHASRLLVYPDNSEDGEPVEAMKVRIARAKKSKNAVAVLSLFISQSCKKP